MTLKKVCGSNLAHIEGIYSERKGEEMKFIIKETGEMEQSTITVPFDELKKNMAYNKFVLLPFEKIPNVNLIFLTMDDKDEDLDIYIQNQNIENGDTTICTMKFRDLWELLFV